MRRITWELMVAPGVEDRSLLPLSTLLVLREGAEGLRTSPLPCLGPGFSSCITGVGQDKLKVPRSFDLWSWKPGLLMPSSYSLPFFLLLPQCPPFF